MAVGFDRHIAEKLVRSEGGFVEGMATFLGIGTRVKLTNALMALEHAPEDPEKVKALYTALKARTAAVTSRPMGMPPEGVIRSLLDLQGVSQRSVMPQMARCAMQDMVTGQVFRQMPLTEVSSVIESKMNSLTSFYGGFFAKRFAFKDLRMAVRSALEQTGALGELESEQWALDEALQPDAQEAQVQKRLDARQQALHSTRKDLARQESQFVSTSSQFVENSKNREECRNRAKVKLTEHLQKVTISHVAASIQRLEDLIGEARKRKDVDFSPLEKARSELAEILSTMQVQTLDPNHARMLICYSKQAKSMVEIALDSKRGIFAELDSAYTWGCECSAERKQVLASLSYLQSQVAVVEGYLETFDRLDMAVQEANKRRQKHNTDIADMRKRVRDEEKFFTQPLSSQQYQVQKAYVSELKTKERGMYALERCTREATWKESAIEGSISGAKSLVKTAAAIFVFSMIYDYSPKIQGYTQGVFNYLPKMAVDRIQQAVGPIVWSQRELSSMGSGAYSWSADQARNAWTIARRWWSGSSN